MVAFLNGEFLPEVNARLPINDRGFLYGDGLFETLRVYDGVFSCWDRHWARLSAGAGFLKLPVPFGSEQARSYAQQLLERNALRDCIFRINLSRGSGRRGYSPRKAENPTFAMTLHPPLSHPGVWRLATVTHPVWSGNPLARFKTTCKLANVLAKAEAEEQGADEALMLTQDGFVAQGASSNLFWMEENTVCTAPLAAGILPGITRSMVIDLCREKEISFREGLRRPEDIRGGVFGTLSSFGLVPVSHVDNRPLEPLPQVEQLKAMLEQSLRR